MNGFTGNVASGVRDTHGVANSILERVIRSSLVFKCRVEVDDNSVESAAGTDERVKIASDWHL